MKKLMSALLIALNLGISLTPMSVLADELPVTEIPPEERARMKEEGDASRQARLEGKELDTRATSKKITIKYVSQGASATYCGPAAVSMILKTVKNKSVALSTLADELNTDDGHVGTYATDVYPVLNSYLGAETYDIFNVSLESDLEGDVKRSINAGYPLMYDILTNNNFPGYSSRISHYIVGNGYANLGTTRAKLTYNDPNGDNPTARGEHVIEFDYVESALMDNEGGYYIAKSNKSV